MDLDKIKKTWHDAEIKTSLDEEKIQQMLDTRAQTALEQLLKYEKRFRIINIVCILFLPIFWMLHIFLFSIYLVLVILAYPWQEYKIKQIKSINLQEMNLLEVSSGMAKYKKSLTWELVLGFIVITIFLILFVVLGVSKLGQDLHAGNLFAIIYFILLVIVSFASMGYVYYKYYWKNIKQVEMSIQEIKEFEEGNKE